MVDRSTLDFARSDARRVGVPGIILRGMFLACSWTWCIGMFFPVLFVGDFGLWGWVAFAVPNVIGAGAMGYVLRRQGASEAITSRHLNVARWFSVVTLLFHVSFVAWFSELYVGHVQGRYFAGAWYLMLGFVGAANLSRLGPKGWARFTVGTYLVSVGMAVAALVFSDSLVLPDFAGKHGLAELAMVTPVLVFGFTLCPYLDLTFHRVRRETPGRAGVAAFWLGFVGFFLPMIVLTLFYAGGLLAGKKLSTFIAIHIFVQSTFTAGAHIRELHGTRKPRDPESDTALGEAWGWIREWAWVILGLWLAVGSVLITWVPEIRPGYPAHRLLYELFMSLYALVFPAYVWIVVIERGLPRPTRLALFAAAVVAASPCFWLGYIEQHYIWLIPGVALPVLLPFLWLLIRGRPAA